MENFLVIINKLQNCAAAYIMFYDEPPVPGHGRDRAYQIARMIIDNHAGLHKNEFYELIPNPLISLWYEHFPIQ